MRLFRLEEREALSAPCGDDALSGACELARDEHGRALRQLIRLPEDVLDRLRARLGGMLREGCCGEREKENCKCRRPVGQWKGAVHCGQSVIGGAGGRAIHWEDGMRLADDEMPDGGRPARGVGLM
jgi:hypothetical protein